MLITPPARTDITPPTRTNTIPPTRDRTALITDPTRTYYLTKRLSQVPESSFTQSRYTKVSF